MQLLKAVVVIATISNLFSCVQNSKATKIVQESPGLYKASSYYPNGFLKREGYLKIKNNDTLIHGITKYYYESGRLEGIRTFHNGKEQGLELSYFKNGGLKFWGWNWEDNQISSWYFFRESSNITKNSIYEDSILVGNKVFYIINSTNNLDKSLIGFESFRQNQEKVFQQNYSEEGEKTFEKGAFVPSVMIFSDTGLTYKVNDTLSIAIFVTNPPGYETYHYYYIEGMSNQWREITPIVPYNLTNIKLDKQGQFQLKFTSLLKNLSDGTIKSDTSNTQFIVKAE